MVGNEEKAYVQKNTKHKNIKRGLVTVYCLKISAFMIVKNKRYKRNNSSEYYCAEI